MARPSDNQDLWQVIGGIAYFGASCYFILTQQGRDIIAGTLIGKIFFTIGLIVGTLYIATLLLEIMEIRGNFSVAIRAVVALLPIGLSFYFFMFRNPLTFKPFEPYLNEYLFPDELKERFLGFAPCEWDPTQNCEIYDDKSGGYISGKVITINRLKGTFDEIFFALPSDLRARTPEEVGTIIWIDCVESVVATYVSGAKGYSTTCTVTVIDKTQNLIVAKSQGLVGEKPPSSKSGVADWHGKRPLKEIIEYIKALPTQ